MSDWLAERTERVLTAETLFSDLNADYRKWCEENGVRPISGKKLGTRLAGMFPKDRERSGRKRRLYTGINLLNPHGGHDGHD